MSERDEKGRFIKGNRIGKLPTTCPYCHENLEVVHYTYLRKKGQNTPLQNGKTTPKGEG